jgi:hypothetical protein
MTRQLSLLETPPSWRLDDATREVGRRGVAAARASLQAAIDAARTAEASPVTAEHPTHRRSAA